MLQRTRVHAHAKHALARARPRAHPSGSDFDFDAVLNGLAEKVGGARASEWRRLPVRCFHASRPTFPSCPVCFCPQFEKSQNKPAIIGYSAAAVFVFFTAEWLIHLPALDVVSAEGWWPTALQQSWPPYARRPRTHARTHATQTHTHIALPLPPAPGPAAAGLPCPAAGSAHAALPGPPLPGRRR